MFQNILFKKYWSLNTLTIMIEIIIINKLIARFNYFIIKKK